MDFATIAQQVGAFLASGQGDFVGGIAASMTIALFNKAYVGVRRRLKPTDRREALEETIERALIAAFLDFAERPERFKHYVSMFGEWAVLDDVADYLVLLIDPRADEQLDIAFLAAQFASAEFTTTNLEFSFDDRIGRFIALFYEFARRNPILVDDAALQIDLLQKMLGELTTVRKEQAATRQATERTAAATEQLAAYLTFITGEYLTITQTRTNPDQLKRQSAAYIRWLNKRSSKITLRGIERDGRQVLELPLETAYVPLKARTHGHADGEHQTPLYFRRQEPRDVRLDEILDVGPRLVITGGPGSGKTTVLRYIAWALTELPLRGVRVDLIPGRRALTLNALPLPIYVPLSEFAAYLDDLDDSLDKAVPARKKTLPAFISHYLGAQHTDFDLPGDFFAQLMRAGRPALLLLDGLDEVPDESRRVEVREAIEQLADAAGDLRIVVTCRSAAFRDRTILAGGFQEVTVQPLGDEEIAALVTQAYGYIFGEGTQEHREKTKDLLDGIAGLEEERQLRLGERAERLVTSPLLVRMLIIVHARDARLPDQRAELYMKATDAMLLPPHPDEKVAYRLANLIGGDWRTHRDVVQHLAYHMHQFGERQGREIDADGVRAILAQVADYAAYAEPLLELTKLRGTLLEERNRTYRFLHLSFQEFLTARYMAEVLRAPEAIARFLEDGPVLDSWWREPALLVSGYLSASAAKAVARAFLERLAGLDAEADGRNRILHPEKQLAAVEIAATSLLEWQGDQVALREALATRLIALLTVSNQVTRPALRATAGDTLARLGDTRRGVGVRDGLPDIEWCYVPPGRFWMGSEPSDQASDDRERPADWHDIDYGYWIARYPVTVAQLQAYVDATGKRPRDEDALRDPANRPVCRVTWYEARDFCRWLDGVWLNQFDLPERAGVRYRITLPNEPEWEKAARGGEFILDAPHPLLAHAGDDLDAILGRNHPQRKNDQPRRIYPWGDDFAPNCANAKVSGIGRTCAVGLFPDGQTPYGALDMSGNVYEWTRSQDRPYPYRPHDGREQMDKMTYSSLMRLRGGAHYSADERVRCAARSWNPPHYRNDALGLRLVLSPLSASDL